MLVLRNVKGSPLTYTEMDNNLTYLEGLGTTGNTLTNTLSNGNETGGNDIVVTNGDGIVSGVSGLTASIGFVNDEIKGGVLELQNLFGFGASTLYNNITPLTSGSGTGLVVNVRRINSSGVAYIQGIVNRGVGYSDSDTITILGTDIGLSSPAGDKVFNIESVIPNSTGTTVDNNLNINGDLVLSEGKEIKFDTSPTSSLGVQNIFAGGLIQDGIKLSNDGTSIGIYDTPSGSQPNNAVEIDLSSGSRANKRFTILSDWMTLNMFDDGTNGGVNIDTFGSSSLLQLNGEGSVELSNSYNQEILISDNSAGNKTTSNSNKNSVFVGTRNSTINSGVVNSVVVGGSGITATASNTVYVPSLVANGAVITLSGLPTYADNAAAVAGGLAVNRVYKTATGELRIVV
jgi:hypothetical protein